MIIQIYAKTTPKTTEYLYVTRFINNTIVQNCPLWSRRFKFLIPERGRTDLDGPWVHWRRVGNGNRRGQWWYRFSLQGYYIKFYEQNVCKTLDFLPAFVLPFFWEQGLYSLELTIACTEPLVHSFVLLVPCCCSSQKKKKSGENKIT